MGRIVGCLVAEKIDGKMEFWDVAICVCFGF